MSCCGDSDALTSARNGKSRSCTDVVWLCLFILFWFCMIFIAAFALVYGNPLRLINGYDSFGNTCGLEHNEKMGGLTLSGLDTSDKSYLFYLDVRNVRQSLKICVKMCPNRNMKTISELEQFYNETGSMLCRYDLDFSQLDDRRWVAPDGRVVLSDKLGPCPVLPVFDSVPVLNRCIPRPVHEVTDAVLSNLYSVLNSWDTAEQVLSDLYASWRQVVGLTFVAFGLSLLMICVLHFLASIVAWIFMMLVSVAAIAGTSMLWWTYCDIKRVLDATPESQMLEESIRNERAFLVYSVVATVLTVVLLLLVVAVRRSVSHMAEVFRDAAACLAVLPHLFLQPVLTFATLMAFFAFWVSVVVCLATSSYAGARSYFPFVGPEDSPVPTTMSGPVMSQLTMPGMSPAPVNISLATLKTFTWLEFVEPTWVRYMWWIYLIGLVWVSEFILSCQQMVIAGSVAHWYFDRRSGGSLFVAIGNLMCYHLGSVAKGSLLITVFKVPRLVLTYVDYRLQRAREAGSSCASCLTRCCTCCLYCLERFIRFMNHNAYTVVALEGHGFCTSARIAWDAMVSNALDLVTINSVGDFILFLGKCTVTAVTGGIGLLYLRSDPHLHFYAVPTFAVCVFAFFVAHAVLSLYEIVIDTIFLCKCEAKRLGSGAPAVLSSAEEHVANGNSHELTPMNGNS